MAEEAGLRRGNWVNCPILKFMPNSSLKHHFIYVGNGKCIEMESNGMEEVELVQQASPCEIVARGNEQWARNAERYLE